MAQTIKLKRSASSGAVPSTSSLELGEVAINTYDGKMYIKKNDGSDSVVEVGGTATQQTAIWQPYAYTATNNQTTFTGSDDNSRTMKYIVGYLEVYVNGLLLDPSTDYTATNGVSIVLSTAASASDLVQINTFVKVVGTGDITLDTFTGNGSTVAYTLSVSPGSENNTQVYVNAVYQNKDTYTVSGTTLTFDTAPVNNAEIEVTAGSRNVSFTDVNDLTISGDLVLADTKKLKLGDSNDLEIYHDTSNSIIRDNGAGHIQILSGTVTVGNAALSKTSALFSSGGAQTLYHDNSPKFVTSSAGIGITGNIAVSGTVDGVDIATRDGILTSTTTTAGAALPKAGGAMTGAITTNSTFDGRDVATDGTKLDGIEVGADVTDTANVTSSGALMDSEVTNLAQVKAFDSSDYATAAQGTTANAALPKAGGTMTGDIFINGGSTTERSVRIQNTGNVLYAGVEGSSGNRFVGSSVDNAFFGTTSDSGLEFATHNNVRMVVDGDGNVGIGETSPDGKLHIKGSTATGDASHILFENTQGSKVFAIGGGSTGVTNSHLYFRNVTDNTRPMVITDAGNVGIGTDAPGEKLVIKGTTSFMATNSTNRWMAYTYTDNTFRLNYNGAGADELVINSSGHVGIGTDSPVAKLHIQGAGTYNHTPGQNTTSDFVITSSEMADNNAHSIMQLVSVRQSLSTGNGSTGYLGFSTMDDSNAQGIRDAGRIAIVNEVGSSRNSATALSFWTNAGGTDTTAAVEKMRITSAGKVGIGTLAPDALLHVSATSPHIDIGPQGGNRGKIGYHSNDVIIGSTSGTGSIIFKNNISSTGAPQTDGDVKMTIADVGLTIHSDTYNILNLQTDSNNDQTSTDGIIKITNNDGSSDVTKAEFRWDESEDLVHVSYGDHGRHVSINSTGKVGIGTGSTSPTATLDVAGTALVENAKLKAIAESNTNTAVDVFVYDTRKDSDGGAWRKRTQNTSWYNETLNTSTRGARKEFPSVAVFVVENTKLTIYDGDDPDMSMWIVFDCNTKDMLGGESSSGGSWLGRATALNGGFYVASYSGYSPFFFSINFISEKGSMYHYNYGKYCYNGDISSRNDGLGMYLQDSSASIVHLYCRDVAATVLPNAPIDADTGLPVPTLAVATDGGVSVIKDNGTVVDLTGTSQGTDAAVDQISFVGNHSILFSHRYASEISTIPTVDTSATYYNGLSTFTGRITNSISHDDDVHVSALSSDNNIESIALNEEDAASKSVSGLSLANHYRVASDPDRVSCFITSDYNTGWMNGDIKLATLSDTDTTNVTGSELITNGTFASNTTGWTSTASGTISNPSGQLGIVTNNNNQLNWAYQTITCVVGKTYTLSADFVSGLSNRYIYVSTAYGAGGNVQGSLGNAAVIVGTNQITFTATATTIYVSFGSYVAGTVNIYDNVSVRLAEEDRSVNSNGLQVVGTVTKTAVATGAELVGYSGFSTGNYLEQPYNSALDFGTGDFSVMGWFKTSATAAEQMFLDRSTGSANIFRARILSSTSKAQFAVKDNTAWAFAKTNNALDDNNWHFLCGTKIGGTVSLYIDGILEDTASGLTTTISSSTSPTLDIGHEGGTNIATNSSLALWRVSATAPTPEQIAKIYNDEKHLFQTNAKATLYGTSNAVTALAYDDDTELLHAGTSAGRSVFQGLNRVDNTTDAVGAAISASNGLVAED